MVWFVNHGARTRGKPDRLPREPEADWFDHWARRNRYRPKIKLEWYKDFPSLVFVDRAGQELTDVI
ncbi:MAG: hypothetical protein AAGD43_22580, partial [Pseudomonadota bacterium]